MGAILLVLWIESLYVSQLTAPSLFEHQGKTSQALPLKEHHRTKPSALTDSSLLKLLYTECHHPTKPHP